MEHYKETGYPLAVKLGTITPDGAGQPSGRFWDELSFVHVYIYYKVRLYF